MIFSKRNRFIQHSGFIALLGLLLSAFSQCTPDTLHVVPKIISTGNNLPLEDILYLNDSLAYAVGGKGYTQGIIISSKDGGNTWKIDTIFEHALWAITKNNKGYINAVGFSGKLFLKEPNKPWDFYRLPIYFELTGTLFDKNGGAFLSSGQSFKNGKIIHLRADYSVDTVLEMENEIQDIKYADENNLVAVGFGAVFNSTDNGHTWTRNGLEGDYFLKCIFPEPGIGYLIGFSGTLYKTNDAGKNWSKLKSSGNLLYGTNTFLDICASNTNTFYISGQRGLLLKFTNGGADMVKIENFSEDHLNALDYRNKSLIVCSASGKIYKFQDL